MLKIYDLNKNFIHQWQVKTPNSNTDIEFIVHCPEILTSHSDENSLTLFYGFLDQDYHEDTPAEYVSKLLKNKGLNSLKQCYGSFIVLHHNKQSNEMLLANDALGDFAAHYYQTDNTMLISDFPEPLLNRHNTSLNESRLLHYFALTKPQNNACFFADIKQLKPGSGLIINSSGVQQKQYYRPSEQVNFKAINTEILAEEFRSLMQSAIRYQTQGHQNIAVMMSGGMDSTFVAGNALKTQKKVSSFSYVFPNHIEADESRWLASFRDSKFTELDMHTFSGEPHWPLKLPVHISANSPFANPYRQMKDVIYNGTNNKNIKFLLTGGFADHMYTGYIYWLIDQIKVNPLKGLKCFITFSQKLGFINGLRQISPLKWSNKAPLNTPWLTPEAYKYLQDNSAKTLGNNHPHPQQWALTFGLNTAQSNWLENEYAYRHNILIRHPFRDRRVVEFLMALPAYVLGTKINNKAFVRKASKDILPNAIIRRRTITSLEPLFRQGVLKKEISKVTELLSQSQCSWHHYIQKKNIHNILKNPSASYQEADLLMLWQCISYELWQLRLLKFQQ